MQSRDEFLSMFSDAIDVVKLREIEVVGFGAPHMDRLIRRLHAERAADSLPPRAYARCPHARRFSASFTSHECFLAPPPSCHSVRTREGATVEAQTNHATPLVR